MYMSLKYMTNIQRKIFQLWSGKNLFIRMILNVRIDGIKITEEQKLKENNYKID